MPENRSFPAGSSPLPAKPRPAPGQRYLWPHSQYKPQDIDLQAQNEISPPISGCCLFPHAAGQPPGCLRRAGRPHPAVDQPAPVLPVGDGLRPAPLGKASFHANFCWFPNVSNHRVGADLCVRPLPLFARPVHGPTHRSAPTKRPSTPKNRAGTEPRPYSRRMPVRDLPGHPQPRLPQGEMPGMTTGTPLSSFVPCSNVLRNRNPRKLRDGFQRRAQPSLWS